MTGEDRAVTTKARLNSRVDSRLEPLDLPPDYKW
jgi:hypothetical protein